MNQEQKKVIEGHLSPSETTKAVQTGETQLIVVTDSRMLTITETSEAGQDTRQVNSTLLTGPHVVGSRVEHTGSKPVDVIEFAIGFIVGIVGLSFLAASSTATGVAGSLAILVGLGLLIGGGYICYSSFDTNDGELKATILTLDDEPNHSVTLPENSTDVARSISMVVGSN